MDGKDGLILWTLGGAGVLFLYAAWAKKSPRAVLASTLGAPAPAPAPAAQPAPIPAQYGTQLPASYSTGSHSGTAYLYDSNGLLVDAVPDQYQNTAATYIPAPGVLNA